MVILDAGHGAETRGKSSPDGEIREWAYCRRLVAAIAARLEAAGVAVHVLVPENSDVPLRTRCRRANAVARANPGSLLVSVHLNAAGNGQSWRNATGFGAYVEPNASARSRSLAAAYTAAARAAGLLGNRFTPPQGYNVQSLAICRDTACPAVLTENLFMDSREDAARLLSPEGFEELVRLHTVVLLDFAAR